MNFDERADFGMIANGAAVEVYERKQLDAFTELHIVRNTTVIHSR